MKGKLAEIKSYNRDIAKQLNQVFTPLAKALHQEAAKVNEDNLQKCLADLKLCLVDYKESKYDIYCQKRQNIAQDNSSEHQLSYLNAKEISYFYSFLEHLNEVAVLKPYNFVEFLTGNFIQYLWVPVYADMSEANNHAADTLVVPIGEYGIDNTLLMLLTTFLLVRLADNLKESGLETETKYWSLLSVETLRGRKKLEKKPASNNSIEVLSTLDTLKEGIQSYQATLSILTAKKVPQNDFEQLLDYVITKKLPQKIAAKVPFSYILPSIRQGIFFENVFDVQTEGLDKLNFNNQFKEYWKETQELYRDSRIMENGKRNPGLLGTGCPIAQKLGGYQMIGINYIGAAYLHIYNLLKKSLDLMAYKKQIYSLRLEPAQILAKKIARPNVLKIYNVNEKARDLAKTRLTELKELDELTEKILLFWFGKLPCNELPDSTIRDTWFAQVDDFDQTIRKEFGKHIEAVKQGKYLHIKRTPAQTLALIILLDQFSRNAYRGTKQAYASDQLAEKLSLDAIDAKQDLLLPFVYRWFLYMPLQHSECIVTQQRSVEAFSKLYLDASTQEENTLFAEVLQHAVQHRTIIKHFDRFPFRNNILQRNSSSAEKKYLNGLTADTYYNAQYFSGLALTIPKTSSNYNYNKRYSSLFLLLSLMLYQKSNNDNYGLRLASFLLLMLAMYSIFARHATNRLIFFFHPQTAQFKLSSPNTEKEKQEISVVRKNHLRK